MNSIINLCFLCTKDYKCVAVDDKIMSQVEYLLPEITIFKLGIPLRICPVCYESLFAFSKFKHSSVESCRRLEARIKGAQGPLLHTGSPPVVDDSETSDAKPEKMEEIFIKEEYVEQTPVETHTQMHTNRAFLNPIGLSETNSTVPHNQLHKDRMSQNIQLHTNSNGDNIEEFFIKEEKIEETPQGTELYNNILKEECVSNLVNDDTNSQPEHNTEDESATLNTVCEGSSTGREEETDILCKICNKSFTRKSHLTKHMKDHSGVRDLRCDICNKTFKWKCHLTYHMNIHFGIKNFRCEICGYSCTRKGYLPTHMKSHSEVKEFQCENCDKSFKRKSHLTAHMKIHVGVKDFKCNICNKEFLHRKNFLAHQKVHFGVKDFQCNICGKEFLHKNNFVAHQKIHSSKI